MSKRRKKTQKFVVFLMIFAILASSFLMGAAMFF